MTNLHKQIKSAYIVTSVLIIYLRVSHDALGKSDIKAMRLSDAVLRRVLREAAHHWRLGVQNSVLVVFLADAPAINADKHHFPCNVGRHSVGKRNFDRMRSDDSRLFEK